jgi:hypothetical protein
MITLGDMQAYAFGSCGMPCDVSAVSIANCQHLYVAEQLYVFLHPHRWRKLEGSDPSTYEMIQKIQTLQKRLISKTEEAVEKDLLIQVNQRGICAMPVAFTCVRVLYTKMPKTGFNLGFTSCVLADVDASAAGPSCPVAGDLRTTGVAAHAGAADPLDSGYLHNVVLHACVVCMCCLQEKEKLYVELKGILARQPGPEVAEQLSIYQVRRSSRNTCYLTVSSAAPDGCSCRCGCSLHASISTDTSCV